MHSPLIVLASSFTDVRPGLLIWTWITFILVAVLLRKYAWGPLLKAVDDREANILQAIESAKHERSQAEKLVAEGKNDLARARQEAAEQVRRTQTDMEKFREELMAKARKESDDLKVDARRTIEEERVKAVNELKAEAVKLSILIAEKLLTEKLDDARQQQLAQQFLTELSKKQKPSA
jgi:F-type H+-transporting ATPase subunit b